MYPHPVLIINRETETEGIMINIMQDSFEADNGSIATMPAAIVYIPSEGKLVTVELSLIQVQEPLLFTRKLQKYGGYATGIKSNETNAEQGISEA